MRPGASSLTIFITSRTAHFYSILRLPYAPLKPLYLWLGANIMALMSKHVWVSLVLLVLFGLLGWYFLVKQEVPGAKFPFRFGLDLVGGTELVYKADTTEVEDVS